MTKQLDITQSVLVGVTSERRDEISQPKEMICDGCGCKVYLSKPTIAPAREAVFARGNKLYICCLRCAGPFMDAAIAEGRDIEGTPAALRDVMPELEERRRRFLRSN